MAAKQTGNAAQGALGPIRTKYKSFSLLALVCLITALCVLYLVFAWNRYSEEIAEDALSLPIPQKSCCKRNRLRL